MKKPFFKKTTKIFQFIFITWMLTLTIFVAVFVYWMRSTVAREETERRKLAAETRKVRRDKNMELKHKGKYHWPNDLLFSLFGLRWFACFTCLVKSKLIVLEVSCKVIHSPIVSGLWVKISKKVNQKFALLFFHFFTILLNLNLKAKTPFKVKTFLWLFSKQIIQERT